jgi:hypothetical protein
VDGEASVRNERIVKSETEGIRAKETKSIRVEIKDREEAVGIIKKVETRNRLNNVKIR